MAKKAGKTGSLIGILLWFEILLQTLKLQRDARCFLDSSSHMNCTPGHIIYRKLSNKLSKSLVPLFGLKVLHKVTRQPVPQDLESLFSEHQSAVAGDVASQCSAKGPISKVSGENKATEKWYSLFHPDSVSILQRLRSQANGRSGIRILKERGKKLFFPQMCLYFIL